MCNGFLCKQTLFTSLWRVLPRWLVTSGRYLGRVMSDSELSEDLSEEVKDKLKKENDRMKAERLCVTCKYFPRTKKFLPCAHLCVCNLCVFSERLNGFCPICIMQLKQLSLFIHNR